MVKKIISKLYEITLTPKPRDVNFSASALSDLLEALNSCDEQSQSFPSFSDEDIRDYVYFIVRFVDAPDNLRGILRVESCIRHLLSVFLSQATTDGALQAQFMALLDRWFYYLKSSVPSDLSIINKRPLIKDSPLLFFHYSAFKTSFLSDNTYPFYAAYAHTIHVEIRVFKRKNPGKGQYESAVRAARYLFVYMSPEILTLPTHPAKMPKKYQDIFFDNFKKKVQSEDIETLMEFYRRLFKQLTGKAPVKRRAKSGAGKIKGKKKKLSQGSGNDATEIANVTLVPEKEQDVEFASGGFLSTDPEEIVVAKKPSLSRYQLDSINNRSHHFWWDKNSLKLDEIYAIYEACTINWGKSDQFDRIIIYILLLLHFGYDAYKLLKLTIGGSDTPRLEEIEKQLFFIITPPLKRDDETNKECRSANQTVYLAIPYKLSCLIQPKLHQAASFFDYKSSKDNQTNPLLPHHIVEFLDQFVNKQFGLRITITRIHSSFPTLYSGRFALDPIDCCYVSGDNVHGQYHSQLHYLHINPVDLARKYLDAFERFDFCIIYAKHTAEKRRLLEISNPDQYRRFFCQWAQEPRPLRLPVEGYGSPKVPIFDNVRNLIICIRSAILNSNDLVIHHNLFVSYTYLCLEYGGGMRPRNTPEESSFYFVKEYEAAVLRDKASPIFAEERLMLLPPTALALISRLRSNLSRLRILIATNLNSGFFNTSDDEVFYFFDHKGIKIDFTLGSFRACLREAGIDYHFPDNSPRHYFKTYLREKGVSIEISDALCGHSHANHELLNKVSSNVPAETFFKCKQIIENMLVELGFDKNTPYLEGF